MDYNELFKERTKKLPLEVISVFSGLHYSDAISVIRKQVIRSSTSVAANYRAVVRVSLYYGWNFRGVNLIPIKKITLMRQEAEEIVKTCASYHKKIKDS
jgi:hypothetical protein